MHGQYYYSLLLRKRRKDNTEKGSVIENKKGKRKTKRIGKKVGNVVVIMQAISVVFADRKSVV